MRYAVKGNVNIQRREGENCMEDQRKNELAVIIAETVAFGFLSRLLVRIPYMVFGDFSSGFFISNCIMVGL